MQAQQRLVSATASMQIDKDLRLTFFSKFQRTKKKQQKTNDLECKASVDLQAVQNLYYRSFYAVPFLTMLPIRTSLYSTTSENLGQLWSLCCVLMLLVQQDNQLWTTSERPLETLVWLPSFLVTSSNWESLYIESCLILGYSLFLVCSHYDSDWTHKSHDQ